MAVPDKVLDLVERFGRNQEAYRRGAYNETQVRREFIDPFFKALGWDVDNEKGYAEAYKDVVHEDAIKVGRATKAPDYCFRIGGARKFFLEAKKPSVDIKNDVHPAYQLRRYAWSAKLPLSILTDFEELAVYDCRIKPDQADKAAVARTLYLRFTDYAERWEEIAAIFAREAVLRGSFDQYVESSKLKRGTAEVDNAFLQAIESWREQLARNLALRNPQLSQRELNFAVQRTIDRIIFLRIGEDRGLEPYGSLMALLNAPEVYSRLAVLFRRADDRYNSGLFHFRPEKGRAEAPDDLTLQLSLDDKLLKEIIRGLYYPDSPYEFSVLPADILGQVYEQFLGKVIRLTAGHRAVVEEKPEVRKAGGVYYTPTYIVEYIVRQTVGKLVEGKRPGPRGGVSKLRILDPACGSGSFLLGAYQFLLDWHRDQYVADGVEKWAMGRNPTIYQAAGGEWRLTTGERKRILLNNIYGVDIDPQAVETTKLSLLLKVLEEESAETLNRQLSLFQERVLPDLAANIQCGNSLIGPDFYDGRQMSLLSEEEHYRINVFDWHKAFREVMLEGGFDAVIGNPPYGIVFDEVTKPYLESRYVTFIRNNDTYVAFIQKAIALLKSDGLFGFIVPNTFLLGPYFDGLKRHILETTEVHSIVDFGLNQVFAKPNVFTALLFLQQQTESAESAKTVTKFAKVANPQSFPQSLQFQLVNRETLNSLSWIPENTLVARLLQNGTKLDDLAWVKDVGLNYWTQGRGKTRGGSIADRVLYNGEQRNTEDRPYLKGRDIDRYSLTFGNHWLRHDYQELLDPKVDTFRFSPEFLQRQKIVYRQTADRIIATLELNLKVRSKLTRNRK
ncbi:MAG: N-6 DNA methylase [Chloroflexota bacterium]